ncbi:MAG: ATP-binding cassette domain-containing protein [Firmicutes bacterium]|nr:ATP-binding cassette domain-containing protein [Bacillota bacterium]
MIEFKDVTYTVSGREILSQLNLKVPLGKTIVIIGPSGCGKSTLLRLAMGLIKPTAGQILLNGQPLTDPLTGKNKFSRGMVFQSSALFDFLSVYDNIAFGLQRRKNLTPEEIKHRVSRELERVGLGADPSLLTKRPAELSGGMQKRVALARTLAMEPKIILYDEPTNGLDPIMAGVITELILQVQRSLGVTSLLVTHDLKTALRVGDEIGLLFQGKIRELGPPLAIMESKDPLLRQFVEGVPTDPLRTNGEWCL